MENRLKGCQIPDNTCGCFKQGLPSMGCPFLKPAIPDKEEAGEFPGWAKVINESIDVPDHLDELVNSIGFQVKLHTISQAFGEPEMVCRIARVAELFFNKHPADNKDIVKVPLASYNHDTVVYKNQAERINQLEKELATLQAWKESAMTVMNNIDLQAVGKELGIKPGLDIGSNILPEIRNLKQGMSAELLRAKEEQQERNKYYEDKIERLYNCKSEMYNDLQSWKDLFKRYMNMNYPQLSNEDVAFISNYIEVFIVNPLTERINNK